MIKNSLQVIKNWWKPQRAHKRIFKIDVGDMAKQETKQYIEDIKKEIASRRIPGTHLNE